MNTYDYLIKIVVIGDSGVGKSAIMKRLTADRFEESYQATIGIDFAIKTLDVDGKIIKIQLWDTAGQEKFRGITASYYRGAHAIMLVFDVTNVMSFHNIQRWRKEVDQYAVDNVCCFLIGNKCDLVDMRSVDEKQATKYASKLGVPYLETSAKTGHCMSDMIHTIVEQVKPKMDSKLLSNDVHKKKVHTVIASEPVQDASKQGSLRCC